MAQDVYDNGGIDLIDGDIFVIFNDIENDLSAQFNGLRTMQQAHFSQAIFRIAERVAGISQASEDIVLGAVHIGGGMAYSVRHQLNCAIISAIMADVLQMEEGERISLIAATLTQNVGMIYLQELLEKQPSELSAYQWDKVRTHTLRGVQILRTAGVTDEDWLMAVQSHHERVNGRGYPHHLKGDEINLLGRVVAVADVYCALIKKRAYRGNVSAVSALREMLMEEGGGGLDRQLVQVLVKTIGIYPPGSLVQLSNREVAIVVQRGLDAHRPVVYSIADGRGTRLEEPEMRDCADGEVEVVRMISSTSSFASSLPIEEIWNDIFMLGSFEDEFGDET